MRCVTGQNSDKQRDTAPGQDWLTRDCSHVTKDQILTCQVFQYQPTAVLQRLGDGWSPAPHSSAVHCAALLFGFAGPALCWAVSLQACPLHRGPVQALPEHESVPVHEVRVDVCILNCSCHKGCTLRAQP